MQLVKYGVSPKWSQPPQLVYRPQNQSLEEVQLATQVLKEYEVEGVVRCLPEGSHLPNQFCVPWFVLSKQESQGIKHRLITNCKPINHHIQTKPFRLDHLQTIFPYLRRGQWGAKIDLKDAYFHLVLHPDLAKSIKLIEGNDTCEFMVAFLV